MHIHMYISTTVASDIFVVCCHVVLLLLLLLLVHYQFLLISFVTFFSCLATFVLLRNGVYVVLMYELQVIAHTYFYTYIPTHIWAHIRSYFVIHAGVYLWGGGGTRHTDTHQHTDKFKRFYMSAPPDNLFTLVLIVVVIVVSIYYVCSSCFCFYFSLYALPFLNIVIFIFLPFNML